MVFLVAEIGVNWDGDLFIADEMMKNAKNTGFDAVKFQAFNEKIIADHPEKSRLLKTAITEENIHEINNLAKSIGIEWFCTPMYPEAVDLLEPYVKRFKIRESDGKPLLENKTSELIDKVLEHYIDVEGTWPEEQESYFLDALKNTLDEEMDLLSLPDLNYYYPDTTKAKEWFEESLYNYLELSA